MEQMHPRDTVFLYVEKELAKQAIMTAFAFVPERGSGRQPDHAEIARWIADRAVGLEILRQRVVRVPLDLDLPYWAEDPEFTVDNHLVFHTADRWEDVRTLLAGLLQSPMDESRPPWELHVITGVRGIEGIEGEATVAALKMHHAAADGMLSADVARRLFAAEPAELGAADALAPVSAPPSPAGLLARAVGSTPRNLGRLAQGLLRARSAQRAMQLGSDLGIYRTPAAVRPRTTLNQPLGPDRIFNIAVLPLGDLRAMKAKLGEVTINDLALSVIGGALWNYLNEMDDAPEGSLAAGVPMSTRTTRDEGSRNQFVTMAVDLHTDIADPVDRARAIHRSAVDEKARKNSPASIKSDEFVTTIPGFAIRAGLGIIDALPTRDAPNVSWANTLITNVPKGAADLKLCDSGVAVSFSLCALVGPSGIAHWVDSVGDVLTINVTADPLQLTDDGRYVELLRESYDELEATIMNGATG